MGPFPFSRVCVARANSTAGMCRRHGGLGEKTTSTPAVEPSGHKDSPLLTFLRRVGDSGRFPRRSQGNSR